MAYLKIAQDREEKAVVKLARLVPCNQEDLLNITLRLILNLSFDSQIRSQIIKTGLLANLVGLLYNENHRIPATCILYNLSIDNKSKSMFTYTNCIDYVMKAIVDSPTEQVDLEVIALGINLALDNKCALHMIEYSKRKGLKFLIKRAFKFKDSLIMKMIRNISQHDETKNDFCDYVGILGETIAREDKIEFLIEVVGTLGNLNISNIDYEMLLNEYGLVGWIKKMLQPGNADDDLVLDVIVLVGAVCIDNACASMLSMSGIIEILIEMLNAKQEDDEIVLQIVYVFYQMIFHKSTREIIIKKTQAPAYLIDLMNDKNSEVRRICSLTLDIISDFDEEWARKIQIEKFRFHNSQWIDMIENAQMAETRSSNMNITNNGNNFVMADTANHYNNLKIAGYTGLDVAHPYNNLNDLNDYLKNPDDEPLENYLAVQDADMIATNKLYNTNDYYITETMQNYDGRISPDGFDINEVDNDLEFVESPDCYRNGIQSRMGLNSGINYSKQMSYEHPVQVRQSSRARTTTTEANRVGGHQFNVENENDYSDYGSRPKTGHKYVNHGIQSSHYLDDSNNDNL